MTQHEGTVAVPTPVYRLGIWLIGVLMSGAIAMSGWSLMKLNELGGRMAAVEVKLQSDALSNERAVDKLQADMDRLGTRLETKMDSLIDVILKDRKQ